jgi:hypothetical protein
MKPRHRIAVMAFLLVFAGMGAASAGVAVGVAVGNQGQANFYLALGDYYRVPQKQIVVVRQSRIPDEELPVVFFIAKKARVSPDAIVRMRLARKSWVDIARFYRLSPDVFYVNVKRPGGPYGRAYGYYDYRKYKRHEWNNVRFSDSDMVNFVNLRFLSEHYRCQPDEVVQWRSGGKRFYEINENLYSRKYGKHEGHGRWDKDRRDRQDRRHDRDDHHDHDHEGHDHDRH